MNLSYTVDFFSHPWRLHKISIKFFRGVVDLKLFFELSSLYVVDPLSGSKFFFPWDYYFIPFLWLLFFLSLLQNLRMSWGWQPKQSGHRMRWEVFFLRRDGTGKQERLAKENRKRARLGERKERRGRLWGGQRDGASLENSGMAILDAFAFRFLLFHFVFTFIIPPLPLLVLNVSCWGLDFVELKLASLALFFSPFPFLCSLL